MKKILGIVTALFLMIGVAAVPATAGHHANPCNPCGMKKMEKHNPCAMKKMKKHNPCNPCGMKKVNPCNPCSMKHEKKW